MATVNLTRTVRFSLKPDGALDELAARHNGFAGWPAMQGLGRYYEIHITAQGSVESDTGYFLNIKTIDAAVRTHALPILASYAQNDPQALGPLMREITIATDEALQGRLITLSLQLTPSHAITLEKTMNDRVLISQQFDFAAAHRLHVDSMTEQQNQQIFGKCNNPSGHGHNYRLQVTVACPIDSTGRIMSAQQLDQIVDEHIIERFDHKHLNCDSPEFADLNPSVENIARVIYNLLDEQLANAPAELHQVKVWETDKTSCTYPVRA